LNAPGVANVESAGAVLLARQCVVHRFGREAPHHLPGALDVVGTRAVDINARLREQLAQAVDRFVACHNRQRDDAELLAWIELQRKPMTSQHIGANLARTLMF
jgi:hypothetical protein